MYRSDTRLKWLFSSCLLSTPDEADTTWSSRSTWGKTWLPQPSSNPHWSYKWWMDTGDTCHTVGHSRRSECRCARCSWQAGHNIMEMLLNVSEPLPCQSPSWEQKGGWSSEGLVPSRFNRTWGAVEHWCSPQNAVHSLPRPSGSPATTAKLLLSPAWIQRYLVAQTLQGRHLQVVYCLTFFSLFLLLPL